MFDFLWSILCRFINTLICPFPYIIKGYKLYTLTLIHVIIFAIQRGRHVCSTWWRINLSLGGAKYWANGAFPLLVSQGSSWSSDIGTRNSGFGSIIWRNMLLQSMKIYIVLKPSENEHLMFWNLRITVNWIFQMSYQNIR